MTKSAVIDPSGKYRYLLTRTWDEDEPYALFVMLNPSTADAEQDDPTIRRCIDFATRWGYGGLRVVNVFAYRSTDPKTLLNVADPVGPDNYRYISAAIKYAGVVIAAWGASGPHIKEAYDTVYEIARYLKIPIHVLGVTKNSMPKHPLYIPKLMMPKLIDPSGMYYPIKYSKCFRN